MINVAINGFGRIGRNILRALYERPDVASRMRIVAINDLGTPEINAHLLQFDTTHGRFGAAVTVEDGALVVDGDRIAVFAERNPEDLPWGDLNIDVVFECTGIFTSRDKASAHVRAGARKVLISAPSGDADETVVFGVNHDVLTDDAIVVSNASCTTNCLAPMVAPLHAALGVEQGLMTTIHAFTNDQNLSDVYHTDLYRARSATQSMIPTKTGAAAAIGLVMPELKGRLDGLAIRVPTINVSLVDLTFTASRDTSAQEVNEILASAAAADPFGVLACNTQPLVSADFNHNAYSSNFDANHTRVNGRLVKVLSWYDNEWGFSNRMLDTGCLMAVASVGVSHAA
ncbi:type I glyceraldehyde-3-phosphate dehydrogenase [Luminiphilus sp.]|jgi:glyceraldehyde 3-phosphate dehydrogenase|nr:type I glyceraldehyde-3-phosphate dehydrogenase [Luminiphilus sp.]MDA9919948.1 type I glyceraldehyde-3-phosphate dehydrogenase [bacterium]MDA9836576.1 type I glyceraldehyde-3-phosphate dehydrogenase [Luminiphilus sp.]MDA9915849.1 type I glyceraldehyde-3-phosphate dehydrogenase [Luminiphilus sp.]MDB2432756.1 type I glyceraldehyde-3-phosphate dehydrogenase [Luminiphilus sp.]